MFRGAFTIRALGVGVAIAFALGAVNCYVALHTGMTFPGIFVATLLRSCCCPREPRTAPTSTNWPVMSAPCPPQ
jgi:hypothetical protein